MSEYWVSKKKYFCKYCDIYIADDAPSRQQHENGLRHKGNTERFIRGLYKTSEKRKKDLEEEKREMARVEQASWLLRCLPSFITLLQAAQAAFAQDIGAGHAKHSTSAPIASTSAVARKPVPKPSNPFTNYSTAESLGYQDPDAERLAAEAEMRRSQGVAGDWQLIAAPLTSAFSTYSPPLTTPGSSSLKREAETILDEDDTRQFKLRKRTFAGLGEVYDPGIIPVRLKKKEETPAPTNTPLGAPAAAETSKATDAPKWTKVQWKRPGDATVDETGGGQRIMEGESEMAGVPHEERVFPTSVNSASDDSVIKSEQNSSLQVVEPLGIKPEHTAPPTLSNLAPETGGMFKKRKIPVGGTTGRRQL